MTQERWPNRRRRPSRLQPGRLLLPVKHREHPAARRDDAARLVIVVPGPVWCIGEASHATKIATDAARATVMLTRSGLSRRWHRTWCVLANRGLTRHGAMYDLCFDLRGVITMDPQRGIHCGPPAMRMEVRHLSARSAWDGFRNVHDQSPCAPSMPLPRRQRHPALWGCVHRERTERATGARRAHCYVWLPQRRLTRYIGVRTGRQMRHHCAESQTSVCV
jgi:hypothetical protein